VKSVALKDRPSSGAIPTVGLGDRIQLEVSGLSKWQEEQKDGKPLHVFVSGTELKNVTLHSQDTGKDGQPDVVWAELAFDNSDAQNRKAWVQVLGAARDHPDQKLLVTIGPEDGAPFRSDAYIKPDVFNTGFAIFAGALLLGVVAVLVRFGIKSNLLRNANVAGSPHSLAKYQMMVWFLIVLAAYLFVSGVTGVAAATSATALTLIGISGATGLSAITIDKNKQADAAAEKQKLQAEQQALTETLDNAQNGLRAQLTNAVAGTPETLTLAGMIQSKAARLAEVNTLLSNVPPPPTAKPHWYLDLLSDENGVSFHRLQMAVWTLVLVGVFVRSVWKEFAMPDFDATTLGLMGISSGTYLGFKFPEQK